MGRKPAALLLALGTSVILSAQPPEQPGCGGRSNNPRSACPSDVDRMTAALPDKAPARPQKPRKVLVLGRAAGYVHSSIPLAAKTIEAMGARTGAWTATTTYDAADINTANLAQYDAIFLASTTGCFLDDPKDAAATAARKAALLEFVRGGKGIAGIHAASDSYHGTACAQPMASAGEPLWPFPLVADYRPQLDSEVADINHIAGIGRGAGSIVAALFLREFAGSRRWAHLDIAGVGRSDVDSGLHTKGGTGFGARLLLHWLEEMR